MIISVDEEKSLDRIQYIFVIKIFFQQTRMRRGLPQLGVTTYEEPIAIIILNSGRQKDKFSSKDQKQDSLPLLFNIVLKILAKIIRQGNQIKDYQIGRDEITLSLSADNMILCMEKYF